MSRADEIFIRNCRDILDNGIWDTDRPVRPKWDDGQSAHTIKKFGIINRYNLAEEFPILTLRRTYWKSAIDELLWIWQLKSNNVHDLRTRVWDAWADENGSIGKAYGYQLGVKHHYPQGDMDQAFPTAKSRRCIRSTTCNPARTAPTAVLWLSFPPHSTCPGHSAEIISSSLSCSDEYGALSTPPRSAGVGSITQSAPYTQPCKQPALGTSFGSSAFSSA